MTAYHILFCSWQTHLDAMLIYSTLKALSYITTTLTTNKIDSYFNWTFGNHIYFIVVIAVLGKIVNHYKCPHYLLWYLHIVQEMTSTKEMISTLRLDMRMKASHKHFFLGCVRRFLQYPTGNGHPILDIFQMTTCWCSLQVNNQHICF